MLPVAPGIFRGPQPKDRREFAWLAECGIKTIIDLENERGEADWEWTLAREAGINFNGYPLSAWTCPSQGRIDFIVREMSNPRNHPVLIHCLHGQDRTGLVVGIWRREIEGWTKERAWSEMLSHGFHPILLGLTWYFWTARAGQTAGASR